MKKISFVIFVVMIIASLSCLSVLADGGETSAPAESYKNVEIAYANVNYTSDIEIMFAIPAYEDLPADAKMSVIFWPAINETVTLSYNDVESAFAFELLPEEKKVTIDSKEHFVYKTDVITAEMMTDVFMARPVIILANGSRFYGDVVDYSIVEYVKTAKGDVDGIPALANQEIIDLLDAMLDFGAMAQLYAGANEPYRPYGFLASDQLNKINIIPVYDGVEGDVIFGGYFKAGASFATLNPIPKDIYTLVSCFDAEGKELIDTAGDKDGIQFLPLSEGDVTVKVLYQRKTVFDSTIENAELGEYVSSANTSNFDQTKANQRVPIGLANLSGNSGTGVSLGKNEYNSYTVINDPIDPESGDKVLRWTGTNNGALYFHANNDPIRIADKIQGIGDTVEAVVTFDLVIAGGKFATGTTSNLRIRSDFSTQNADGTLKTNNQMNLNLMKVEKGKVYIATSDSTYVELCELVSTAYTRIAITYDFTTENIRGYAGTEDGELKLIVDANRVTPANLAKAAAAEKDGVKLNQGYDNMLDWLLNAQKKIEWYGGSGSALNANHLSTLMADLDDDGTPETKITADGTIATVNREAYIKWFEDNRSIIVKDVKLYAGGIE